MSSSSGSNNGNGNVSGRHPLYRGVRQRKTGGKWVSEIRVPRSPNRIWLGSFSSPEMAAIAYDVAALALKGPRAEINFPNAVASLPVPASTSPQDIQAAAASAASAAGAAADAWTGSFAPTVNVGKNVTQSYQNMGMSEFVDEDLTFDMPNVIANMAQGMLLSPPRVHVPSDDSTAEYTGEQTLWNYP